MGDVTFVISDLGIGGAQRVLVNLANQLAGEGYKVTVVTMDKKTSDYFQLDNRITRIALGLKCRSVTKASAAYRNILRIVRMRNALKKAGAKTVVSFLARINITVILASRFLDKRIIISERNDPSIEYLGRFWEPLRKWTYSRADVITANSGGAVSTMARYVPREKLWVVPNVMIPASEPVPAGARKNVFLAIGRLEEQKAYDVLLKAYAKVTDVCEDWKLVVIGTGSQEDTLKRMADDLYLDNSRLEWIPAANPIDYYNEASVFVLPSRFEGTPNVMLEAMARGICVIVSDASPGPLDYVEDGNTGLVVGVEDENQLAESMIRLARDSDLRMYLGARGRDRVLEDGAEDAVRAWKDLLQLEEPNDQAVPRATTNVRSSWSQ